MIFPGGEVHTSLSTTNFYIHDKGDEFWLNVKLKSSEDIMEMFLITDALRRKYPRKPISLNMGYIPYARQDRVCNEGESLAIKVFADLINLQGYNQVIVLDPHSDVAPALINKCFIIHRHEQLFLFDFDKYDCLVCPDAGARKKCMEDAKKLNLPIVYADKVRDLETGKLSGFEVHAESVPARCLITDDICDGGGTFIGLAQELRKKGATTVDLLVSHGIFSKGLDIFKGSINTIYAINHWEGNAITKIKVDL